MAFGSITDDPLGPPRPWEVGGESSKDPCETTESFTLGAEAVGSSVAT